VEKGFLKREESSRDRRVRELTLTEEGRKISEAASKFRREFHQKLLSRYAEPERQKMLDTLTMLRMGMESLKKELCEDNNENH
jgi:DNA-binding MarR family transcriptional regulator